MDSFEHDPETLYVGTEGGLLWIDEDDEWDWIYRSEGGGEAGYGEEFRYTYVTAVWVNPTDSDHVVFGGASQEPDLALELYETTDGGDTVERVQLPGDIPTRDHNTIWDGVVAGEDQQDFVFLYSAGDSREMDGEETRSRLVLRRQ